MPEEEYTIELGKANVVKEGKDVTIITYGAMVQTSQKAAELLEKEDINVEVIDLRTISPFDMETIVKSVEKTGRAVVVQEAQKQAGVAANVIAEIQERAILSLEAPVVVLLHLIQYFHLLQLKTFGFQMKKTSLLKLKK